MCPACGYKARRPDHRRVCRPPAEPVGLAVGDAVAAGWPQDLAAGLLGMIYISKQNEATVRLCALTAANPPSANYRATIVRTF